MSTSPGSRVSFGLRWLRFNLIGVVGILVQLAVLWVLVHVGMAYMFATALAVETTVLHNWVWHERYTWADRAHGCISERLGRLFRFHLSNSTVSLLGNLLLMNLLVGHLHLPVQLANLIAITVCSLPNFWLGDRFVFRQCLP